MLADELDWFHRQPAHRLVLAPTMAAKPRRQKAAETLRPDQVIYTPDIAIVSDTPIRVTARYRQAGAGVEYSLFGQIAITLPATGPEIEEIRHSAPSG